MAAIASALSALLVAIVWSHPGTSPLLESTEELGGVDRIVVLSRSQSSGPFTEVITAPERLRGVDAEVLRAQLLAPGFDQARRDFDGDGTLDTVADRYDPSAPFLADHSIMRLRVLSGADGRTLLDCRRRSPLSSIYWCEDQDGNGSHELLVESGTTAVLLAYVGHDSAPRSR